MRELSSAMTFFCKFVFPTFWIGLFAFGTLLMFVAPEGSDGGDVRSERWTFLAATVVGGSFIYWACGRLKRVRLGSGTLVISNFMREAEISLRDVEAVSGSIFLSPELVWLRFRRPTPFGSKIVFMPKTRLFSGFSRHPLVAELRALVSNLATHSR